MKQAIFNTHGADSQYNDRVGETVTVLRPLTKDEADIDDVGNMYKIQFSDGLVIDAFEDELTEKKMDKEQLDALIDEKIDEIFLAYQEANGIKSGDIFPEEALELDKIRDALSDLVIRSMSYNTIKYTYVSNKGGLELLDFCFIDSGIDDRVRMLSFSWDNQDSDMCFRIDVIKRTDYDEIMKQNENGTLYECFDECGIEEVFRKKGIKEELYIQSAKNIVNYVLNNKEYFDALSNIEEKGMQDFITSMDCYIASYMDKFILNTSIFSRLEDVSEEKADVLENNILGDDLSLYEKCEIFKKYCEIGLNRTEYEFEFIHQKDIDVRLYSEPQLTVILDYSDILTDEQMNMILDPNIDDSLMECVARAFENGLSYDFLNEFMNEHNFDTLAEVNEDEHFSEILSDLCNYYIYSDKEQEER